MNNDYNDKFNNELITVIVPVYNAEKYIDRCVQSIISQSYSNLEIILVDDGSKDNSISVCNSLLRQDERIKVISQQNMGAFEARKAGIKASTGKYITFIDSDDYVDENLISTLYTLINSGNYQISSCSYQIVSDTSQPVKNDNCDTKSYNFYNIIKNIYNDSLWSLCTKLYKRELFDDLLDLKCTLSVSEDLYLNYNIYKKCENMVLTNQKLYYYYRHSDSVMASGLTSKKVMDSVTAYRLIEQDFDKSSPVYPVWVAIMLSNDFFQLQKIVHSNSAYDCYDEIRREIISLKHFAFRKESKGILTKNHRLGLILLILCPKAFNIIVKRRKW